MKTIKILFLTILAFSMNISCSSQSNKSEDNSTTVSVDNVEVYYFHTSRRCATCKAIESVSKEAVAELYGEKVSFTSYNLDETEGKEKGEEVGVSGQTLLIVSGDTKTNITNEGFMHARSNPEKLKEIIKTNIDPLL